MNTYLSKRAQLVKLTQEAEQIIKDGFNGTHNQAILNIYRELGHGQRFRTLEGWNRSGFLVETGQKGLPLWAKGKGDINSRPIVCVFSEQQVFKINGLTHIQAPVHEPKAASIHVNL